MRRDDCRFADYKAWFQRECDGITLESGFTHVGPILDPLPNTDFPPWGLDFAILYTDGMYIRVGEYYRPLPRHAGGGGCLQYLSYHYGPYGDPLGRDGFPVFTKDVVLRIDIDERSKRHAHYQQEDHIPEARLAGLDFDAIDPFQFIRAVEEHRRDGKSLHEILGFKVEPLEK